MNSTQNRISDACEFIYAAEREEKQNRQDLARHFCEFSWNLIYTNNAYMRTHLCWLPIACTILQAVLRASPRCELANGGNGKPQSSFLQKVTEVELECGDSDDNCNIWYPTKGGRYIKVVILVNQG